MAGGGTQKGAWLERTWPGRGGGGGRHTEGCMAGGDMAGGDIAASDMERGMSWGGTQLGRVNSGCARADTDGCL